jgi:hypothetical protein
MLLLSTARSLCCGDASADKGIVLSQQVVNEVGVWGCCIVNTFPFAASAGVPPSTRRYPVRLAISISPDTLQESATNPLYLRDSWYYILSIWIQVYEAGSATYATFYSG